MDGDVMDREAAVDDAAWDRRMADAAWDRRMAEARRPPPEVGQCAACGRWSVEDDTCADCGAVMVGEP